MIPWHFGRGALRDRGHNWAVAFPHTFEAWHRSFCRIVHSDDLPECGVRPSRAVVRRRPGDPDRYSRRGGIPNYPRTVPAGDLSALSSLGGIDALAHCGADGTPVVHRVAGSESGDLAQYIVLRDRNMAACKRICLKEAAEACSGNVPQERRMLPLKLSYQL